MNTIRNKFYLSEDRKLSFIKKKKQTQSYKKD